MNNAVVRTPPQADYARWCGPRTLATLAGLIPSEAAEILDVWRRRYGMNVSAAPFSTPAVAILRALIERGYNVEEWHVARGSFGVRVPHDRLVLELVDCFARDKALVSKQAKVLPEPFHILTNPKDIATANVIASRLNRRIPATYTVQQWLARRRRGSWFLAIEGHALAVRSGRTVIPADAELYAEASLIGAWRISRPNHQDLMRYS